MKNLAFKLLFGLAAAFLSTALFAHGIAQASGFDVAHVRVVTAIGGILVSLPSGSLAVMSSGTITAFRTQFGAYYMPGGQNAERLRKLLMQDDAMFAGQFPVVPIEGDTIELGLMSHTRVLQAFKPYWSPTGQLSGTPRRKVLDRVKVNIEEIPDLLVNTWLGFLATEGGKDPNINRATWPFVRWYMERYLVPQAKQDQYYEAYYGVRVDPGTNNTAGLEGESLDGIAVQLNQDIDDGLITPINTGAFDDDPEVFVDQVEAWFEQVDNRYRGMPMDINLHDTYAQRFKQGMMDKYNIQYKQVEDGELLTLRKRSNVRIIGHTNWLQGVGGQPSQKLFCTPAGNRVKLVRVSNKEEDTLRIEQVDYTLKLMNDWHVKYTWYDPRVVFTNDRELDYGM